MVARKVLVNWLSNYSCKGIDFRLGDNGCQLFYEADRRGITWIMLRPKLARYWVVIADQKGHMTTLNCCTKYWDGTVEKDPLYHEREYTEDLPVALLSSLAKYIHSGANPFKKE